MISSLPVFLSAEAVPGSRTDVLSGFESYGEAVAESDGLSLYVDEEAATFMVHNSKDNSTYSATPFNWDEDEISVGRFHTELSAVMIITYLNGVTNTEQEANCVTESVYMGGFEVFKIKNGVIFNFDFPDIGITVPLYIKLDNGALTLDVPVKKISEYSDNRLLKISLCPYFGAGSQSDDGYLFVPDGSGALINFNNGKTWAGQYNGSVYGNNLDVVNSQEKLNLETAKLATFGIKRNDTAFLAVIESGGPQASIYAFGSGVRSGYNSVYAQFEVRESAVYKLDEGWQGTKTFMHYQESKPTLATVRMKYFFLEKNSGYTEMALRFREYLIQKKQLKKSKQEQVPLISVLGALNVQKNIIGISYTSKKALTSVKDLSKIATEIRKKTDISFNIRYFNWSEQSASGTLQNKVSVSSALGSRQDINSLSSSLKKKNIGFYLDVSPWTYKNTNRLFQDFFYATKAVTGVKVLIPSYKLSTGAPDYNLAQTRLVMPQKLEKITNSLAESIDKYDVSGVSVSGLSGLNYSHFGSDVCERWKTQIVISNSLKNIGFAAGNLMLNNPSQEQLKNAKLIFNVSDNASKMHTFDCSVPFYQLVISGMIPYNSSEINLNENSGYGLLYSLRYGSAPHYIIGKNMKSDPLYKTDYEEIIASKYADWKEQIISVFTEYQDVVNRLGSTRIVDFRYLSDEVTETIYDGGSSVIVNTGKSVYSYGDIKVDAGTYAVYGG